MRRLVRATVFPFLGAGVLVILGASCALDSTGEATSSTTGDTSTLSSTGDGSPTSTSASSGTGGSGGAPTTPSCIDGVKSGDESDVDCGGDACLPCGIGESCSNHGDCASLTCASGMCAAFIAPGCPPNPDPAEPTCADCILDGGETDVDCGGDACGPCADGDTCATNADCASGSCVALVCTAAAPPGCDVEDPDNATCNDCIANGGETDVDCGGDACGPCALGAACLVDADCASKTCALAVCQ